MSQSKNYDNNKNNVQLKSNLVEYLNEVLSVENASVDRIVLRIRQTPIQEVKQRLRQHLKETHIQKNRLRRIITGLGRKPTNVSRIIKVEFSYFDNDKKEFSKDCRIKSGR
jgi:ferritin-like metal-binding protein YciE